MTSLTVLVWLTPEAAKALNTQWMQQFAFWYILKAASLSVLNFMPIMLGATAAKRLGANMWVGAAIPAALMTGTFTDLTALADPATKILNVPFFGMDLPLYAFSYTGQVFPPLLAVALLAPFERFLKKVIPSMLQMVFVPNDFGHRSGSGDRVPGWPHRYRCCYGHL